MTTDLPLGSANALLPVFGWLPIGYAIGCCRTTTTVSVSRLNPPLADMPQTLHALDYLSEPGDYPPAPVCVLFGDEPFLKRLVREQLRGEILGRGEGDLSVATFEGPTAQWRDVLDELATVSLFGGGRPRLVVIQQADDFVSRYRARLEDHVAHPQTAGILVLEVDTWPSTTRLYQAVARSGLQIECRAPEKARGKRKQLDEDRLCQWLTQWSARRHDAALRPQAARLLLELVGPQLGLLDQELAKLALFAGPGGKVTAEMVRDVVGGWRIKTTWELIDAALDGKADEALRQLDRLLQAGQDPVALLGPISWSLRRFAAATRIYQQAEQKGGRPDLLGALEQAGFRKWPPGALEKARRQLLQLGRARAGKLYGWLLDADLALKGTHSAPQRARFVLERLIVRLSRHLRPPRHAGAQGGAAIAADR